MYKHILVAVDDSSSSEIALAHAIKLAAEHQALLHIVYVVDSAVLFDGNEDFVDIVELENGLVRAGQEVLAKAASAAGEAGLEAETKLLKIEHYDKRIADMIVGESMNWPADVVVVGTHGRRGLSRLLLGSVAENVSRLSQVPVLLVRGDGSVQSGSSSEE